MASDRLIINAAIGKFHERGQRRLGTSLELIDYKDGALPFNLFPVEGYNEANPYEVKASVFEAVVVDHKERRYLLWLDCSCVAVKPLDELWNRIAERGYYLASSGYSAGQTCTDAQLKAAGYTRDEAMNIPDTATGTIGIDTHNEGAMLFLNEWIDWARRGLFSGSRLHDPKDSADPRFLFGRQDQSAATLLAYKYGMTLDNLGGLTAYWDHRGTNHPTACILYKGIQ